MSVVVIAETEHGEVTLPSLECVEEARAVADRLGRELRVLLPGHRLDGLTDGLAAHGAGEVTLIEHEALEQRSADGWLAALEPVLRAVAPAPLLVLAPDTGHTRAWLPRLALRLRAPLISHCIEIQSGAERQLTFVRPTHGGARHEQLACPGAAVVFATLAPGSRGVDRGDPGRRARVSRLALALDPACFRDRQLRTLPPDPRTVDLREAERIVAGGLGVGGPAGVDMLRQLGEHLGAAVGGTRVIADRGWLPTERFIGTTGKIVSPKLYIALGISGASQHTSGMTGSETVIVVNNDRTAPMFGLADLGIVGDLHQLVPALLARLAQQPAPAAPDVDSKAVAV